MTYIKSTLLWIGVFWIHWAIAQNTISGTITDQNNEPLIGATVQIKGEATGTVTDLDGNFRLAVADGQTIVISMIGMESREVKVKGSQPINISLKEATSVLGEVVVTGFQEVNRKLFTGASERLSMEDIELAGSPDVSRALEGQVAGVSVDNVSGTFGTTPKIRIRGNASINGNNQPLFVVDGVILEDLAEVNTDDFISGDASTLISSSIANLNPDDIATFQILKDASATAIYGARAANGVIVITTKKGKSGKLRVSYSGNYSFKLRPTYNQFSLMNSAEEMEVYREMHDKGLINISTSVRGQNYGAMGKMFTLIANHDLEWGPGGGLNEKFLNKYENANTDWFDLLFNDAALQQQHSLSFTAGSENSNSYYSISFLNDEGQTIADNVQRVTGSARNTYFLSDKFTFGLKLTASYRDQRVPGTRNREFDPITGRFSRDFDINPFSYALNTARSIRPYDDEGKLEYFRRNYAPFNILEELSLNYIDIQVSDFSAQTNFDIDPTDALSIKGVINARYANTVRDHTVHENSNQAEAYRANGTQFIQDANNLLFRDPNNPGLNPTVVLPQGGFNYLDQSELISFYSRISADWNKSIGDIHEINVLAGQEIRFANRTESNTTGMGVIYESGGIVVTDPNIIEFFNQQNIDYYKLDETNDRFIGLFLNGGYAYKGRYVGNFTVRYDGSNQLGKSREARYLPTWNVSGAWNVTNEPFFKVSFIDNLKIRGTYGISGNLPPNASALLNLQADVTVRPTDVEPYLYIADLTNTELTWEKLKELNVGADISLFDNRLDASFNYFQRSGFDLIGTVQTSGVGGQGLKVGNFADMSADGFEVSIATTNIKRNEFTWRSSFNIGYTYDQITRLDFGPRLTDAIGQNGAAVLGGPRRGLFSARFAGLNSVGIPTFYNNDDEVVFEIDLQERDDLTSTLKYEGPVEPRGGGGFTNNFKYKGFSLMVLLSYKFDYKIRLNDGFFAQYTDFDALPAELVNRWAVPGDEDLTNIPTILDRGVAQTRGDISLAYQLYNKSTERVADGTYVRLRTVRLSYQLPQQWISKIGINTANVSVEGQNLALLYADDALNGQDPEFFSSGGVALPQPKMVTFSLGIGF
ncbi:SusC/RagA family TonB-linked outer membrane protein [Marinoscillum furvescens]|uniref:TonB-linked SusC/RagA family outer membrane protein n=1 Tax=Marinoscillum furvescens DSM 4134 TaxID=1122208 RepID=A0A3D9L4F5_MARFU|nr:SusC/RagA family TonB-linked outer membrane protein [Marinoscillum furvescens]RED98886.1 TonB-linked SusC/RagA family outer membrane protein [Marinoscillum furvescens DSM 4134]